MTQNGPTSSTTPSSTINEPSPTSDITPDSYNGGSNGGFGQKFSGDGTYFTPGLGACGKTNTEDDLIAAINAPQYGTFANPNTAPVCGRCALVKGSLGQIKVAITDKCPPCKYGDLDLSPAAFQEIGDMEDGRIPITWSFVDC
ncbi:hypothetical protein GGI23_000508 [Coemansia sp. RSA 2559]|nr:hypothetical protein GGI23_000508 [Coemansia sp. RSA 2559]